MYIFQITQKSSHTWYIQFHAKIIIIIIYLKKKIVSELRIYLSKQGAK